MTGSNAPSISSRYRRPASVDDVARGALFVLIFLLVWVSVSPFPDMSDPALLQASEAGSRLNQFAYLSLAAVLLAWLLAAGAGHARPVLSRIGLATLAWFMLTILWSLNPGLSARRLALALVLVVFAAITPLLPRSVRRFADLLGGTVLIVLIISYAGLVLAPELAIHQVSDIREPEHAGLWRGLFGHKNSAGPAMVIFSFIGLFIARSRNLMLGSTILLLATVFLLFSFSKTALGLFPFVLILSSLALAARSFWWRTTIVIGPVLVLNLLALGSLISPALAALVDAVLPDASFTGRADIWRFAIENLLQRPFTGYGFAAFWMTEEVMYGATEAVTGGWAHTSVSGHNGYLDIALTTGLPGLALTLFWIVFAPLRDLQRGTGSGDARLLSLLFLRLWMFGLYAACFESILFSHPGPVWFTTLIAVFGLRYLGCRSLVR
jgi:O-antigen ligase